MADKPDKLEVFYFIPALLRYVSQNAALLVSYLNGKQTYTRSIGRGNPTVKKETIGRVLRFSDKTVQRAIQEAREAGLLFVTFNGKYASTYSVPNLSEYVASQEPQGGQICPGKTDLKEDKSVQDGQICPGNVDNSVQARDRNDHQLYPPIEDNNIAPLPPLEATATDQGAETLRQAQPVPDTQGVENGGYAPGTTEKDHGNLSLVGRVVRRRQSLGDPFLDNRRRQYLVLEDHGETVIGRPADLGPETKCRANLNKAEIEIAA